ncbi:MAG: hypothetical protein JST08_03920 [Actinobacteria bacterium]|nr:hypothetical protein [Actinomycetota bacterium]
MSRQSKWGSDFEERLLVRLKAVVAKRGAATADPGPLPPASPGSRRRRSMRLALAGAAALTIAVVVLVISSGSDGTSRAFAVEPLKGGGVAIKIYSLEGAADLEAALEREGIPAHVDWLQAQMTCGERHLTPSSVQTAMGGRTGGVEIGGPAPALTIGVMTADQYRAVSRAYMRDFRKKGSSHAVLPNLTFEPHSFRPGQSVVIVGSPEPHGGDPEGGYRAQVEVVEGPVPPCKPVPEAAGSIGAIEVSPGGEAGGAAAAEAAVPGPGQFLFTKTEVVQLQSWEPDGPGTGPKAHPRYFTSRAPGKNGMPALVPTTKEVWTAPDGRTHVRETLGRIKFLSPADQQRWEEAGSPPPFEYDPAEHHIKQDGAGNPMKEYSSRNWRGRHAFSIVPKLYKLPTEPEALRLAIEHQPAGTPPAAASSREGGTTVQRLLEILAEQTASPELHAAAFGALAEIPGIGRERDATDAAGRHGEALTWDNERGFGSEVIFDPETSTVLARSEMVFGPPSTKEQGVPPKTVFRETAYLSAKIVDSSQLPAAKRGGKVHG